MVLQPLAAGQWDHLLMTPALFSAAEPGQHVDQGTLSDAAFTI
jgi:hypothetical protein